MDDAKLLAQLLMLAFAAIGLLLGVIGWFLRKDYSRMESGLKEANERIATESRNEAQARAADRHELRDEVSAERLARHNFEVRVAQEYVSMERLTHAMEPLTNAVAGFRGDIKELFTKMDGKQDKGRGGD